MWKCSVDLCIIYFLSYTFILNIYNTIYISNIKNPYIIHKLIKDRRKRKGDERYVRNK